MTGTEERQVSSPCPDCRAAIFHDSRFTPWCSACEWNVDPYRPDEESFGRLDRHSRLLARRYGERLLSEITSGTELRARRDASSVVAQILALLVHATTVALVAFGIWFIVGGLGVTLVVIGFLMLATAFVLRPRFFKLPTGVPLLERSDAPELFELVDDVAKVVGTRGVDRIAVSGDFNASVSIYGIRGRRVLTIGIPLWQILTPQERVAILGHELGHFANGDLRHGAVVWSAANSLAAWGYLLQPSDAEDGLGAVVVNIITFLPWLAITGVRILLDTLTLRATQRGEYLADRFAAEAGGVDAAMGLMDKLLLEPTVTSAMNREQALWPPYPRNRETRRDIQDALWARLADEVESVPKRELERRRLAAERRGFAVDATHPPSHLRRDSLAVVSRESPQVIVDASREAAIDAELAPARRELTD